MPPLDDELLELELLDEELLLELEEELELDEELLELDELDVELELEELLELEDEGPPQAANEPTSRAAKQ